MSWHSLIFEKSWWSVEVHDTWEKANVPPVFKKNEKEDLGNYSIAFSKEVAGCGDKGRAVNVYLDFSKTFFTVSCSLLTAELKTRGLE